MGRNSKSEIRNNFKTMKGNPIHNVPNGAFEFTVLDL